MTAASEASFMFELARPEGLEPPAYWFEANRSIQLSYGRDDSTFDSTTGLVCPIQTFIVINVFSVSHRNVK